MKWPSFLREPFVLDDDIAGRRMMPSPEGVPIELKLAGHGERLCALLLDLLILNIALVLILIGLVAMRAIQINYATVASIYLLLTFFARFGYFLAFEMGWRGQTPGKRVMRICVVDRDGGALSPMALAGRNLMREVEVFMPMAFLFSWQGTDQLFFLAALSWIGVFLFMPLLNRDRLRFGDMVAGTWVVCSERRALEEDLAAPNGEDTDQRYAFVDAQLDVYGITELHALEQLLRREDSPRKEDAMWEVCKRICKKIAWQGEVPALNSQDFLSDYYKALRAHLERHALFGDRRIDKHELTKRARS